jgi:rod shape-determining protein MreB and related proteins
MRDAMKIFGYISPFEHGFALPAYHADADTFNAWYMAVPRIAGDHCAPIDDFEILEGNIEPCEGSRVLEEGDAWNDVFLWDGAAYVGTPKEIFEQIKRARKHMEKEAPFSLLDLALAAGEPGTDKIARQAFAYAKKRMGATQGAICFVEAAIRPGVLLEVCRFAAENDYPVVRSNAVRRIALQDVKRLTADIDINLDFLRDVKGKGLFEILERRIASFGERIGAEFHISPEPAPIKSYGDPGLDDVGEKPGTGEPMGASSASADVPAMTADIAIDLGSGGARIYARGQGVILNEAPVVLLRKAADRHLVLAVGDAAVERARSDPDQYYLAKPIRDGVVIDDALAERMIEGLFGMIGLKSRFFRKPMVVAAVPATLTKVQQKGVVAVLQNAGAGEVRLIPKAMAAAIGADMPVTEPIGSIVVDIGLDTTEVAVISLRSLLVVRSIAVGGADMDEAIVAYIRRHHNLLISAATANRIRLDVGTALMPREGIGTIFHVKGNALGMGKMQEVSISQGQICEALTEAVGLIVESVRLVLEQTPPELAADIVDQGIVLTGGGALLAGLDELLRWETGLPVTIADQPETCTIIGAGRALEDPVFQGILSTS